MISYQFNLWSCSLLANSIYTKITRVPTTPSRGEPIKGVGNHSRHTNPGVTASVVTHANACVTIPIANALQYQLFCTIPFGTIQFHAFEVRLHVFTTIYACYAHISYKITYSSSTAFFRSSDPPFYASALSHACASPVAVPHSSSNCTVTNACAASSFSYPIASHTLSQVIYTSTTCSCVAKIFHTSPYQYGASGTDTRAIGSSETPKAVTAFTPQNDAFHIWRKSWSAWKMAAAFVSWRRIRIWSIGQIEELETFLQDSIVWHLIPTPGLLTIHLNTLLLFPRLDTCHPFPPLSCFDISRFIHLPICHLPFPQSIHPSFINCLACILLASTLHWPLYVKLSWIPTYFFFLWSHCYHSFSCSFLFFHVSGSSPHNASTLYPAGLDWIHLFFEPLSFDLLTSLPEPPLDLWILTVTPWLILSYPLIVALFTNLPFFGHFFMERLSLFLSCHNTFFFWFDFSFSLLPVWYHFYNSLS